MRTGPKQGKWCPLQSSAGLWPWASWFGTLSAFVFSPFIWIIYWDDPEFRAWIPVQHMHDACCQGILMMLSVWLSPPHTLQFCHWFEQAFTLGSGSCWLYKHDPWQDSDLVAGVWEEAVLWGVLSSWRSPSTGTQRQHPFSEYLCVRAHAHVCCLWVWFFSS